MPDIRSNVERARAARLDGIIRAGSFLAVGALLLAAAVIVRRVGGGFGRDRKPAAGEA